MADLGSVSQILVIKGEDDLKGGKISLSQGKYAGYVLSSSPLVVSNCKSVSHPGTNKALG